MVLSHARCHKFVVVGFVFSFCFSTQQKCPFLFSKHRISFSNFDEISFLLLLLNKKANALNWWATYYNEYVNNIKMWKICPAAICCIGFTWINTQSHWINKIVRRKAVVFGTCILVLWNLSILFSVGLAWVYKMQNIGKHKNCEHKKSKKEEDEETR